MNSVKKNIGIVGAGNVASHLAGALSEAGNEIVQVISRSQKSAEDLGARFNALVNTDLSELNQEIDLLILTVPDHVIPEIVKSLGDFKGIVVHTSGAVSIEVFKPLKCQSGIIYPLQTFTKGRELDFRTIPIFIEASDERVLFQLKEIFQKISDSVFELDSDNRAQLHLAAVFVNNFTNYMITAANDILHSSGIQKEVMISLIKETFEKSIEMGPDNSQTGPAIRDDITTIKKHLKLLSFSPEHSRVYQCLTEAIQSRYNEDLGKKYD